MQLKQVTEIEFNSFVEAYPRPLKAGLNTVREPVTLCYFDDSIGGGTFPEAMVAAKDRDGDFYIVAE